MSALQNHPWQELPLSTKKGTRIPNEIPPPLPPAKVAFHTESYRKRFPNSKLRSLDTAYNCMGMVFACRRTAIEPEHFDLISSDDEYRKLGPEETPQGGDVAVYRHTFAVDVVHVGVVLFVGPVLESVQRITVLSKWGQFGEYCHDVRELPESLGDPIRGLQFWTHRKGVR